MQLTYRGLPYTSDSINIDTTEATLTGQYRGSNVRFNNHHVTIPETVTTLHYRGVHYLRGH
jgi:hypothetical protein